MGQGVAKAPAEGGIEVSRMAGIQDKDAGFRTRRIFKRINRRLGRVPLSARIRACDFEFLRLWEEMSAHVADAATVPAKLKELAQVKVAAMVGCPF